VWEVQSHHIDTSAARETAVSFSSTTIASTWVLSAVHNIDQRGDLDCCEVGNVSDTAYGKMIWSLWRIAPHVRRRSYVAFALGGFGTHEGLARARQNLEGSALSSSTARSNTCELAPTPWVNSSQPSSSSIGDPQLPICTNSHGNWASK